MNEASIKSFGKGAIPDKLDFRDYSYEYMSEVFGAPIVNWEEGYEVPESVGIKIEDQNGSSSCVGQSFAKYGEILERVENKNFTDLSAKYIYSQIFLPGGGSYLRDGAKTVVEQGIATEERLPSYPSTEDFMTRSSDITDEIKKGASVYKSKSYASIWHKNNIDIFAQAILGNYGVVTGMYGTNQLWGEAFVRPPTGGEEPSKVWGHAVYCCGFRIIQGKKYIRFINSWSENWADQGYGYLGEDYFTSGNIFSAWTLIDSLNVSLGNYSMKLIILNGQQYLRDSKGFDHHIVNPYSLRGFIESGILENEVPEPVETINDSGKEWAVLPVN